MTARSARTARRVSAAATTASVRMVVSRGRAVRLPFRIPAGPVTRLSQAAGRGVKEADLVGKDYEKCPGLLDFAQHPATMRSQRSLLSSLGRTFTSRTT